MEIKGGLDKRACSLACQGRFVLLRHSVPNFPDEANTATRAARTAVRSHWDFMIEQPGHLMTWQIQMLPKPRRQGPAQTILARRIADHRPLYLDYEGQISGNRGSVQRCVQGTFQQLGDISPRWTLQLTAAGSQACASFNTGNGGLEVDRASGGGDENGGCEVETARVHIPLSDINKDVMMEFEYWGFRFATAD